jgi:hypothetical protein
LHSYERAWFPVPAADWRLRRRLIRRGERKSKQNGTGFRFQFRFELHKNASYSSMSLLKLHTGAGERRASDYGGGVRETDGQDAP